VLLSGRVAIITGGATGMGRSTALKFADEECAVVVADISDENGRKTVEELSQAGREGLFIHCDITSSRQVREMVDQALHHFGKIDILVNNAGGTLGIKGGSIDNATEEDWDRILNLNLKGAFLVCKSVVPLMKEKKYGKIINLSSMGAVHPSVSVLHYHSAKAGIIGLTYNLAFELAPFNICVNAIVPGPVVTPFWDSITVGIADKAAFFSTLAKKEVPLGRVGTPEDISGPALFLASELSSYVTGQIIYAAGGQPMLSQAATFLSDAER
jgi:NAD(P)-dependent dehydrogenase (short-subunit alcohol dehydrogenase family)